MILHKFFKREQQTGFDIVNNRVNLNNGESDKGVLMSTPSRNHITK